MCRDRLEVDVYFIADDVEVTAIFADTIGEEGAGKFTAYAHTGQHTTASPEWVQERRPATVSEYSALLGELNCQGYDVTVVSAP